MVVRKNRKSRTGRSEILPAMPILFLNACQTGTGNTVLFATSLCLPRAVNSLPNPTPTRDGFGVSRASTRGDISQFVPIFLCF